MSFLPVPAPRPRVPRPRAPQQRGIILVITLVAMVVLLVGLAAILRSVDTSGLMVGSLAFRSDLTNRAEQAIVAAKATLAASSFDPTVSAAGSNYSAVKLTNGSTGVPTVLDSSDSSTGYKAIYGADDADSTGDTSITYRYVIDRQCNSGSVAFSTATCEYTKTGGTSGGSAHLSSDDRHIPSQTLPIYRISVRVSGPRNSVAYFQATYVTN